MTIEEIKACGADINSRMASLEKFLKIDENKQKIKEIEQVMS